MIKQKIIKVFCVIFILILLFRALSFQAIDPIALYSDNERIETHISAVGVIDNNELIIISQYKMAPFDISTTGNINNLFNFCLLELLMIILLFRRYRINIDLRQQIQQQICHYFHGSKYKDSHSFTF